MSTVGASVVYRFSSTFLWFWSVLYPTGSRSLERWEN